MLSAPHAASCGRLQPLRLWQARRPKEPAAHRAARPPPTRGLQAYRLYLGRMLQNAEQAQVSASQQE